MNSALLAWAIKRIKVLTGLINGVSATVGLAPKLLIGTTDPNGSVTAPAASRYYNKTTQQDFVNKDGTATGWE